MIQPRDYEFLARAGVETFDISDWRPWPALDFTTSTGNYTVLYGLDTDVFVVWRHNDDKLWTYKYRSDVVTMKAHVYVVVGDPEIPLSKALLAYLGAMIMYDVRKLRPTARAFAASMN